MEKEDFFLSNIWCFLLEQKASKIQGFITMLAFLIRRYRLAIQGMGKHNNS